MTKLRLCVVLPTARPSNLVTALKELLSLQPPPDDIILVVPKRMVVEAIKKIEKFRTGIHIILLTEQHGLVEARNKAIVYALRKSGCDLVWLFEDDVMVAHRDVVRVLKSEYNKYRAVNGCTVFYGREIPVSADEIKRPLHFILDENNSRSISTFTNRICIAISNIFYGVHGFGGLPYKAPAPTLVIAKECFEECCLFDEVYNPIAEWSEPDFIVKVLRRGFKVLYIPKLVVKHYTKSRRFIKPSFQFKRVRNLVIYMVKNFIFTWPIRALTATVILLSSYIFLMIPQLKHYRTSHE